MVCDRGYSRYSHILAQALPACIDYGSEHAVALGATLHAVPLGVAAPGALPTGARANARARARAQERTGRRPCACVSAPSDAVAPSACWWLLRRAVIPCQGSSGAR